MNVIDIKDAPGPLTPIVRRRAEIKVRQEQIREQMSLETAELNALWKEDQELAQAEAAVRKLIERK